MPSEAELHEYYADHYYTFGRFTQLAKDFIRRGRCRSQLQTIAGVTPVAGKSFFELGAADAKLLAMLAASGAKAVGGTEYSRYMRSLAQRRHGIALSDQPVEKLEGPWDMLILSHVLEHFPDIDGVLQHLRRLSPTGLCFIEVPHSPHPEHDPPGDVRHYCDTAHTFNFRPRSLRTIFERNGYDVLHMSRWLLNIPGPVEAATHRSAREMIQSGRSVRLTALPLILLFLLRCGLQPSRSFRCIPLEADWSGKGDNIRLVARPRP